MLDDTLRETMDGDEGNVTSTFPTGTFGIRLRRDCQKIIANGFMFLLKTIVLQNPVG